MKAAAHTRRDAWPPAPVPSSRALRTLRACAATCRACPLWRGATCVVFGEGPRAAPVMLIGEQPGDREDREGRPFIGPAGRLLDRALGQAGIARERTYVTNAVKHFKWVARGPRRLHKKPSAREIAACRPWLEAEIGAVQPELLVCLGATAAYAVFRHEVRVLAARGTFAPTTLGRPALVTVHPSSLLRVRDRAEAASAFDDFVADLRKILAVVPAGGR